MLEFYIHLLTFLIVLFPGWLILKIMQKDRGQFTKMLVLVLFGLLPMALYHLVEALVAVGVIPFFQEGAFSRIVAEHVVVVLAFASFSYFLSFYYNRYIKPIYHITSPKR